MACAQPSQAEPTGHNWTEKADVTWEEMFRFAYQKDLIPLLKELGAQLGREEFAGMLRGAADEVVRRNGRAAGGDPRPGEFRFEHEEHAASYAARVRG